VIVMAERPRKHPEPDQPERRVHGGTAKSSRTGNKVDPGKTPGQAEGGDPDDENDPA
jgi:hypothetical protein